MQTIFRYKDRKFIIEPYRTEQEKELLLIPMYADKITDEELAQCLEIVNLKLSYSELRELSTEEKMMFLYKYREVSIGDTLRMRYVCPHCKTNIDAEVKIPQIFKEAKIKGFMDNNHNISKNDIKFLVSEDLDFKTLKQIENNYIDYCNIYDFNTTAKCAKCGDTTIINIGKPDLCVDNMSEKSINGLYSEINDLCFYSHYTYNDVMRMYPFERDILKGLLEKTLKKSSENTSKVL